jgi:N-methylhydantoinase B/oxoprolinase/acetone carboxylase alpha subunit
MNESVVSEQDKELLDQFINEHKLFYAPDPEIMEDHRIGPRSAREEEILSAGVDPHIVNQVRGLIIATLDEGNTMIEQMGAAPGAKWGDMVAAIYTANGDLSMIAPHGVVGFAGCCHYPIKFIIKYWTSDATVGVCEGDAFIHNDARYGGIHNTDQSLIMPLFWQGRIVAWLSTTIHEGENGACEPGGMPAAAESKYDEGLKMSPLKIVENFEIKRDLMTFLQNSVRDPKLQLEDLKVKLHAVMRLRERALRILEDHGEAIFIATLRKQLEDVAEEARRRVSELPDGTTRVITFPDSTLRENALLKFNLAITVKGDKMTFDLRGSSPEFVNRSINTNLASFKTMLMTCFLQNIWPDLPHTMSIFSPMDFEFDEKSLINGSLETPQAMSLIPLFKAMTLPCIPMAKLSYSLAHRYTAIVAPQYDQPATMIYGGLTQNGETVGNFCADINGNGQGGRAHKDGEHSVSPPFAAVCDIGEMEITEEEIPIVRLGAYTLAKDRVGFGKYRGGLGYEQIASVRGTGMWGFMTGCTGSVFVPSQGMFGGYAPPVYPLLKIRNIDIFEELVKNPEKIEFNILDLMNEQPIDGAIYSSNDMGMTFELVQPGEVYMICQGAGGGYGDVLLRDPALVAKDIEEDLISFATARDIYKVAIDRESLIVDEAATKKLRDAERASRLERGRPFDEFVGAWTTDEPPADLPYYGSWDDPAVIYGTHAGERIRMDADDITGIFMPNPKDVRIAQLEEALNSARVKLEACGQG